MPQLNTIPWAMVSALVASAGVITSAVFQMRSWALTKRSNSAKMVLDFVGSFNSMEMQNYRAEFAKALLENRSSIDVRWNTPVLEFFEELGYMTRRGVLDKGMVWNSFSWWFEPYYLAVRRTPDLIADGRLKSKSPSLFQEIEWLSGIMQKVGKKEEQTNSYNSPNWEHVEAFLRDEAKLTEKIKLV